MTSETGTSGDTGTSGAASTNDANGGTTGLSARRRLWLAIEMALLYIGAPIAVHSLVRDHRVALFTIFPVVLAVFVVILTLDRGFSWRAAMRRGIGPAALAGILAVFVAGAPVLALFAWFDSPGSFLRFPLHAREMWIAVMIVYPLVSVTTQEIMYRVFYYARYRALFGGDAQAAIALNAVLFAFSHIVFQNATTLVISFLGGLLFAWRYETTRSFWAVCLEHALWGNLIFTLGLGRYFYTGVSNF